MKRPIVTINERAGGLVAVIDTRRMTELEIPRDSGEFYTFKEEKVYGADQKELKRRLDSRLESLKKGLS